VLKALALGALVLIGRPVFWGLTTGRAAGLSAMVEPIRGELVSAMALIGATTIRDVVRHLDTSRS
jgi:isopentenyl diphosphate isomerase/L-lactate dehydrogenase-like FMN-dependent dehydrogenase